MAGLKVAAKHRSNTAGNSFALQIHLHWLRFTLLHQELGRYSPSPLPTLPCPTPFCHPSRGLWQAQWRENFCRKNYPPDSPFCGVCVFIRSNQSGLLAMLSYVRDWIIVHGCWWSTNYCCYSCLDFCVDHLYFTAETTEKYSKGDVLGCCHCCIYMLKWTALPY